LLIIGHIISLAASYEVGNMLCSCRSGWVRWFCSFNSVYCTQVLPKGWRLLLPLNYWYWSTKLYNITSLRTVNLHG